VINAVLGMVAVAPKAAADECVKNDNNDQSIMQDARPDASLRRLSIYKYQEDDTARKCVFREATRQEAPRRATAKPAARPAYALAALYLVFETPQLSTFLRSGHAVRRSISQLISRRPNGGEQ